MTDHASRAASIAEAEWRFTAAECRLLLAMRSRARGEDSPGTLEVGDLIDDLARAAAAIDALVARRDHDRAAPRSRRSHASGTEEPSKATVRRNGSFMKPLHIDEC